MYNLEPLRKLFPNSFLDVMGNRTIIITIHGRVKLKKLHALTKAIGIVYDYQYSQMSNSTSFVLRTLNSVRINDSTSNHLEDIPPCLILPSNCKCNHIRDNVKISSISYFLRVPICRGMNYIKQVFRDKFSYQRKH